MPELVAEEWDVLREACAVAVEHLRDAEKWRVSEARLTLHAIADEACAGLGVALTARDGCGAIYRARGRELLARKGSLSRPRRGAATLVKAVIPMEPGVYALYRNDSAIDVGKADRLQDRLWKNHLGPPGGFHSLSCGSPGPAPPASVADEPPSLAGVDGLAHTDDKTPRRRSGVGI
jgi:hypothetical protein